MTQPNYVTPALVAAAFHAVMLFGFPPDGPHVVISDPSPKVVRWPIPPEPVPPPVNDADAAKAEQVKPLAGDPAPPDLPPPLPQVKPTDFPNEAEVIRPPAVSLSNSKLPKTVGLPEGEIGGDPRLTNLPSIFQPGDLDRTPRARAQVAPDYPYSSKQAGVEGTVLVEFVVDTSGRVMDARVLRSDRREFEEPTIRAVLKWRFEPGLRNGRAVRFRMQVPVDFHLSQD